MQKVQAAANPQPNDGLKLRMTACMHTGIRDFKPEIRTINEEEEDLEKAGGKGAKGAKVNGTINDEDFNASLLSSESNKMSESSSGLSSSQSVQPKTKGKGSAPLATF